MTEGPKQLPRAERRAQILRAAAQAFADGGYAVTSMDDVAAAAGVTKLIVYRHFDSKEQLYRAVLSTVSDRMQQEWLGAVGSAGEPPRAAGVRAFLRVARDDPHGYRLLVFHAPREPQFEKQTFGYWEDAVRSVDGLLGDRVVDPSLREWAARSVMSTLLHSVLLWLETGDPAADEQFVAAAGEAVAAMVRSLTNPPHPST